jgi:hypothetical protein
MAKTICAIAHAEERAAELRTAVATVAFVVADLRRTPCMTERALALDLTQAHLGRAQAESERRRDLLCQSGTVGREV